MGWPVGHSRSPRLHGWWLDQYGIDGAYIPLAVPPDRVDRRDPGLAALGLRGANVTVPHKEAALGPATGSIRWHGASVRSIRWWSAEDGTIEGRNTDAFGFMASLKADQPGWRAEAGPPSCWAPAVRRARSWWP